MDSPKKATFSLLVRWLFQKPSTAVLALLFAATLHAKPETFPIAKLEPFDPEVPIELAPINLLFLATEPEHVKDAMRVATYIESLPDSSKPNWFIVLALPSASIEQTVAKTFLRRHFEGELSKRHIAFLASPPSGDARTFIIDAEGAILETAPTFSGDLMPTLKP